MRIVPTGQSWSLTPAAMAGVHNLRICFTIFGTVTSKSGSWLIMGRAGTLLVTSAIEVVQMRQSLPDTAHIVKLFLRIE